MCFPPLYVPPITPEYLAKLRRAKRPASVPFPTGDAGIKSPRRNTWTNLAVVFAVALAIGFGLSRCADPEPVLCLNSPTKGLTA